MLVYLLAKMLAFLQNDLLISAQDVSAGRSIDVVCLLKCWNSAELLVFILAEMLVPFEVSDRHVGISGGGCTGTNGTFGGNTCVNCWWKCFCFCRRRHRGCSACKNGSVSVGGNFDASAGKISDVFC